MENKTIEVSYLRKAPKRSLIMCYASNAYKKFIAFFLLLLFSNMSFAVGWEELSKEDAQKRGIIVYSEFSQSMDCFKFIVTSPKTLHFGNLGNREFLTADYKSVHKKSRGWQLSSKGTQIKLPSELDGINIKISSLCLSESDSLSAYLSLNYAGPQGTPPMMILLDLSDYR
jgi:hypothetical protein